MCFSHTCCYDTTLGKNKTSAVILSSKPHGNIEICTNYELKLAGGRTKSIILWTLRKQRRFPAVASSECSSLRTRSSNRKHSSVGCSCNVSVSWHHSNPDFSYSYSLVCKHASHAIRRRDDGCNWHLGRVSPTPVKSPVYWSPVISNCQLNRPRISPTKVNFCSTPVSWLRG